MTGRRAGAAVLAVAAAMLAAGASPMTHRPNTALHARHVEGGVTVTVTLEPAGSDRTARLSATFRPDLPGFHLYSTDLPEGGVDGLGVPTRLQPGTGMRAAGPVAADRPVYTLRPAGLAAALPVYPDGPVTLSLLVRAPVQTPAEVELTYAACSVDSCLYPVISTPVTLNPG